MMFIRFSLESINKSAQQPQNNIKLKETKKELEDSILVYELNFVLH
jgi:hypothetical protein